MEQLHYNSSRSILSTIFLKKITKNVFLCFSCICLGTMV
nr:MAG TPA: protein of unknown function (DUF4094) [Caudoviricetes sp.]